MQAVENDKICCNFRHQDFQKQLGNSHINIAFKIVVNCSDKVQNTQNGPKIAGFDSFSTAWLSIEAHY